MYLLHNYVTPFLHTYIYMYVHLLTQQGANTDCLKALVAFGADVNPLNEHGLTPLDLAMMSNPAGQW